MRIEIDDVTRPEVLALLEEHLDNMHAVTPAEHVFAFDAAKLRAADVTFWTAWNGDALLGCAALKELSSTQGEVKSMRTPAHLRRTGAGRALLNHLISVARDRGYGELLLETGKQDAFLPAHALYRSAGFCDCGPFGSYSDNGNSVFMSMTLNPNGAFVIRRGTVSDATALAELAARTFRDTFAADNRPEDMDRHEVEAYSSFIQGRELLNPAITTLLVEAGEAFAGFAQIRREPAPPCVTGALPIELWRFYIVKNWHGRGVAQALMRRVIAEASELGARTVWLGVWEHNPRAQAFYRKVGFTDVGTQVFVVGEDVQTERVMVRPL